MFPSESDERLNENLLDSDFISDENEEKKNDNGENDNLICEKINGNSITAELAHLKNDLEHELSKADSGNNNDTQYLDEMNPNYLWDRLYSGVHIFGFINGAFFIGPVNILYPVVVVEEGESSITYEASSNLVKLSWSYSFFAGVIIDCFPIFGIRRTPHMILASVACFLVLFPVGLMGTDDDWRIFVLMLTLANACQCLILSCDNSFLVKVSALESPSTRGNYHSCYFVFAAIGMLFINLIILFLFSGPEMNCPGYESDDSKNCTTDLSVAMRNDEYFEDPIDWCHNQCDNAAFSWGLDYDSFALIMAFISVCGLPSSFYLCKERGTGKRLKDLMAQIWQLCQQRKVWRLMFLLFAQNMLCLIKNSSITNANYVWMDVTTAQMQIMNCINTGLTLVTMIAIKEYGRKISWRKVTLIIIMIKAIADSLYYFIIFDIYRNVWFYTLTYVIDQTVSVCFGLISFFPITDVCKVGHEIESALFALLYGAFKIVQVVCGVLSNQMLAFFPDLNEQESLDSDTQDIRRQMGYLTLITILINLSAIFALPFLPRGRTDTRELIVTSEPSTFWGVFSIASYLVFLSYSTVITGMTVAGDDYGCYKIVGGEGCTEDESDIPVYCLFFGALFYLYSLIFYHCYWPVLQGRERFSFSMFV